MPRISPRCPSALRHTRHSPVDFKQTSSGWRLEVSRGLPERFDIDQSKGFGMQVVKAFVARLTVASHPGRATFAPVTISPH